MSEHTLLCLSLAVGLVTLYISWRMAMALATAKADADKTVQSVKSGPFGPVLGLLGFA